MVALTSVAGRAELARIAALAVDVAVLPGEDVLGRQRLGAGGASAALGVVLAVANHNPLGVEHLKGIPRLPSNTTQ